MKIITKNIKTVVFLIVLVSFYFLQCSNDKGSDQCTEKLSEVFNLKGNIDTVLNFNCKLSIKVTDLTLRDNEEIKIVVKDIINYNNALYSIFDTLNLPPGLSDSTSLFYIDVMTSHDSIADLDGKISVSDNMKTYKPLCFDSLVHLSHSLYYSECYPSFISLAKSTKYYNNKEEYYTFYYHKNSSSILYNLDRGWFLSYIEMDSTVIDLKDFNFTIDKPDYKMDYFLIPFDFHWLFKGHVHSDTITFTDVLPSEDYLLIGIENSNQKKIKYVIKEVYENKKSGKIRVKTGSLLEFNNELKDKLDKMAPEIKKTKEMMKNYYDSLNAQKNK